MFYNKIYYCILVCANISHFLGALEKAPEHPVSFAVSDRIASQPQVNNIFYELPLLETEHLLLRKVKREDVFDLYEIYSDSEVIKYVACELDTSLEDTKKWIEWRLKKYQAGEPTPWAVILKHTNKLIGLAGFCDWNIRIASASLMLLENRSYWKMGFMQEAIKKIMSYGFAHVGLNRIDSFVHRENEASLRFHQKLGFTRIGIIPEHAYYRGSYSDRVFFTFLKNQFLKNIEKGNS